MISTESPFRVEDRDRASDYLGWWLVPSFNLKATGIKLLS